MTLRDLSRDAGISMGALYSYIENKEQLLAMILGRGAPSSGNRAGQP